MSKDIRQPVNIPTGSKATHVGSNTLHVMSWLSRRGMFGWPPLEITPSVVLLVISLYTLPCGMSREVLGSKY